MPPKRGRLMDALNKKLIHNALLTNRLNEVPVQSGCRYRAQSKCVCMKPLSGQNVEAALEIVSRLHKIVDQSFALEDGSIWQSRDFSTELTKMAQHLLCQNHQTQAGVQDLTHYYISAIQRTALAETVNVENLCAAAAEKFTKPILDVLRTRKTSPPKTSAKRSRPHTEMPNEEPQKRARFTQTPYPPVIQRQSMPIAMGADNTDAEWQVPLRGYMQVWDDLDMSKSSVSNVYDELFFPVVTTRASEVSAVNVAEFYKRLLSVIGGDQANCMRKERLRWHPDKIDQKFGGLPGCTAVRELANIITMQINQITQDLRAKQQG